MSHDDHNLSGPKVPIEKIADDVFAKLTMEDLMLKAIHARQVGIGNALEVQFEADTTAGTFRVHFHLCLQPVSDRPAGADHVKH